MTRALITSVLLAGAAVALFDTDPAIALGYSAASCILIWLLTPLLRQIWRRTASRRRKRRRRATPAAPATQLTQINHHHYYGGWPNHTPEPPPARPDHNRLALPIRTEQQKAHDRIYNVIDPHGNPQ